MRSFRGWLICAGMAATGIATIQDKPGSYAEELAAARKAGLPTRPSDMRRPAVPESQNAAPFYRKMGVVLKANPESLTYEEATTLLRPIQLTPAEIAAGRQRVAERRDILDMAHAATRLSKCNFNRDWSQGERMLFPEFASMRSASRWLTGESGLLLRDGKPINAIENMSQGFRIAEHAGTDTMLIGYLVAVAIDTITMRGLENILYLAGDKPGVPESVRQAMEQKWKPRSLASAVRGEMVMDLAAIENIRRGDYSSGELKPDASGKLLQSAPQKRPFSQTKRAELNSLSDLNGAVIVHSLRRIQELADKPYPVASQRVHEISSRLEGKKNPHLELAAIMLPAFDSITERRASNIARAAVVRSAAAILAWKAKRGSLPNTLQDAINPPPSDPIDLKPLRYKREGAGFTVYSIGTTGKFDGHAKDRKQYNLEAVFSYPAPKYRAEAPPPVR